MLFGVASGVSRGKDVLGKGGDCQTERDSFGMNVGHSFVTNEHFVAQLCEIA